MGGGYSYIRFYCYYCMIMDEMKDLKIMILDDRSENINAALEAFGEAERIETVSTFDEGEKLLQTYRPDIAFVDLNFPFQKGGIEERLGGKFRDKNLRPRGIYSCIVTAGKNHGRDEVYAHTEVPVYGFSKEGVLGYSEFATHTGTLARAVSSPSGGESIYTEKDDSKTWDRALEILKLAHETRYLELNKQSKVFKKIDFYDMLDKIRHG